MSATRGDDGVPTTTGGAAICRPGQPAAHLSVASVASVAIATTPVFFRLVVIIVVVRLLLTCQQAATVAIPAQSGLPGIDHSGMKVLVCIEDHTMAPSSAFSIRDGWLCEKNVAHGSNTLAALTS
jgi:hypothetical protein